MGWVLVGLLGCRGSGRIEFASLDFRTIDPPGPRSQSLDLDRATWWVDEHERLWIVAELRQSVPFFPDLKFVWLASLRLEGLPAGRAREYALHADSWRAVVDLSGFGARYHSLRGIAAVYQDGSDHLRVHFRMEGAREGAQLLGGWGRPNRYLISGHMDCVRDDGTGPALAAATETIDRQRSGPPTQAPVTQPAPPPGSQPAPLSRPEVTDKRAELEDQAVASLVRWRVRSDEWGRAVLAENAWRAGCCAATGPPGAAQRSRHHDASKE